MAAPTVGRFVYYTLTQQDCEEIRRRRTNGPSIAERMKADPPQWPAGAMAHIGNPVEVGQECAAQVVAVWTPTCVNLRVNLDGTDTLWKTSISEGTGPGTWRWMYQGQAENTTNQKP